MFVKLEIELLINKKTAIKLKNYVTSGLYHCYYYHFAVEVTGFRRIDLYFMKITNQPLWFPYFHPSIMNVNLYVIFFNFAIYLELNTLS